MPQLSHPVRAVPSMFNSAGGMKVFCIISDGGGGRDGIRERGQRMGEQRKREEEEEAY